MHTPRGTYELKYIFPSHVTTNDGGSCSATAIHALIKKLIDGLFNPDVTTSFDLEGNSAIPGCTDELACNFEIEATENDGSCLYYDCAGVSDGDSWDSD